MTKDDRRSFLKKSSLTGLSFVLGIPLAKARIFPENLLPPIIQNTPLSRFQKHEDMSVLNDRPWNVEAQAHLLDDRVTPASKMFMRNNGLIPEAIDAESWTLTIEGESAKAKKTYSLNDLKTKFEKNTYQLTLECGGNGRAEFNPPAKGNQWTIGAVSCAKWSGVKLADLLADVGVNGDAVYIGYYGSDRHLSGDETKVVISRGVPISKAMMEETLVAYEMNGAEIPLEHGFPLRLVAGGWPASASGKWLKKLVVRNQIHDGPKMTGQSYRVPCEPVAPGTEVSNDDMCIIESMPVKSLITYPKTGAVVQSGQEFELRGHAWAGELEVSKMEFSIDFGSTWQKCDLEQPMNRLAWQHWSTKLSLKEKGYYEIWARATDQNRKSQPMVLPGWNPRGYLNNACHRIAVKVV